MKYLTGMAAIGGFLFGYDTGVISGAMLPMRRAFHLSAGQQEVVVSSTVFAAFVSSLCMGASINDRFGRRYAILISAAVFGVGSIVLMLAMDYVTLVIGRVILGLGIGIASLTTPVYIAEVALPSMRGQLVTINTLMITFGQFFAGMIDGVFDELLPQTGWRYMLGLATLPSIVMFIGFLNLPESPRWLARKGKMQEAALVLMELRETKAEAEIELTEIVQALPSSSNTNNPRHDHGHHDHDNNLLHAVDETTSLASSKSSTKSGGAGGSLKYGSDTSLESHDGDNNSVDDSTTTATSFFWGLPRIRNNNNNNNGTTANNFENSNKLIQLYIMLSHPPTRRALLLGCGLMAVQQCSGINTVMVSLSKGSKQNGITVDLGFPHTDLLLLSSSSSSTTPHPYMR
jgi:MFS family permease